VEYIKDENMDWIEEDGINDSHISLKDILYPDIVAWIENAKDINFLEKLGFVELQEKYYQNNRNMEDGRHIIMDHYFFLYGSKYRKHK